MSIRVLKCMLTKRSILYRIKADYWESLVIATLCISSDYQSAVIFAFGKFWITWNISFDIFTPYCTYFVLEYGSKLLLVETRMDKSSPVSLLPSHARQWVKNLLAVRSHLLVLLCTSGYSLILYLLCTNW